MLQFSQFVWTPWYSVWDVFNNFLLIDATDRSKITSDQKRFFIALSLYPLSFFANTPFKPSENTRTTLSPMFANYKCIQSMKQSSFKLVNALLHKVYKTRINPGTTQSCILQSISNRTQSLELSMSKKDKIF